MSWSRQLCSASWLHWNCTEFPFQWSSSFNPYCPECFKISCWYKIQVNCYFYTCQAEVSKKKKELYLFFTDGLGSNLDGKS